MIVSSFHEIQAEFLARVNQAVYCNLATVDANNRPRSRIMHPVWEESIGWIISSPTSPKAQHLQANPYVSLAYIHDSQNPVYIDGTAEWVTNRDEQGRVWDFYKTVPPPMGFDPEPHYGSIDHVHFGLLKITPTQIMLYTLNQPALIWRQQ